MRTLNRFAKAALVAASLLGLISEVFAQAGGPQDFSRYLPVYELAHRLEARYARPVTVEGPLVVWRGELERLGLTSKGVEILGPRPYSLNLLKDDAVWNAPAINVDLVNRVLDVYHKQNPGRTRYQVLESPMGFHIVPSFAYDDEGVMRPVKSLLDTPINVFPEMRTAAEHAQAVIQAVSQSTGIPFMEVWNFDARYAANGYVLRSHYPAAEDRPFEIFKWGYGTATAREALSDLFLGSATTLTWLLNCGPDPAKGGQQGCVFQVYPLAVGDKRTELYLDRCTKCRPIPK